jgi:hypothetical protein
MSWPGPNGWSAARQSDTYPAIDSAEVRECRRILYPTALGAEPDWLSEVEQNWGGAAELGAQRDLEVWGINPFEED